MLLDKMIWHMEMRLQQPVALSDLSEVCAVSPFHMARSFRMATGMAPMTYVRARRLSVAARALAAGEDDILTVALEAQYNSHEAFTRAFVSYFGVLPNVIRRARSTETLTLMEPFRMDKKMIIDVAPPQRRRHPSFRVVGIGARCSFEDTSEIPQLWQSFSARDGELSEVVGQGAYGVCCDPEEDGHFRYVAGLSVGAAAAVPEGMVEVTLPEGPYAVFVHAGISPISGGRSTRSGTRGCRTPG